MMRRHHLIPALTWLLLGAGWSAAGETPRHPGQLDLPPLVVPTPTPTDTSLTSGIRVLVFENHDVPVVSVRAGIAMGSRYLDPEDLAAYELMAAVWDEGGAGDLTPDEVDAAAAAAGLTLSAWAGDDSGGASLFVTREDLAVGLPLWADLLRTPRWDAERLERARAQVVKDVQGINDSPSRLASTWLARLLNGPETPAGKVLTAAEVAAVTRDDLDALHARFVAPDRTVIGVAGDITVAEALAGLEAVLGDWSAPELPPLEVRPWSPRPTPGVYWLPGDHQQCHLRMGRVIADLTMESPDYPHARLLGFTVGYLRVYYATRQAGLSYGTVTRLQVLRNRATFDAFGSTAAGNLTRLVGMIVDEVDRVHREPLDGVELEAGRTFMISSAIGHQETADDIIRLYVDDIASGLPEGFSQAHVAGLQAVTLDQIHACAERWIALDPDLVVVVVGSPAGGEAELAALGLGPVTVLEPVRFGE